MLCILPVQCIVFQARARLLFLRQAIVLAVVLAVALVEAAVEVAVEAGSPCCMIFFMVLFFG